MRLSQEERSAVEQNILNFISQNPVRQTDQPRLSQWSNVFLTKLSFVPSMAILLILMVLIGGGVSAGAEKALPGDVLYPVKVGLNEEVRGWFSVSEEAKANWEIERAQRRLEEAETLASEGSLDLEARENIEANFEAHADRVRGRIDKFESKENFKAAADVSSKFETSLKVHHRILNRLTVETEDEVKKEVKPIEAKVRSEAKTLIKTRKRMELKASGKVFGDPKEVFEEEGTDYLGPPRSQENDLEFEDEAEIELENNLELNQNEIKTNGRTRLKANVGL